MTDTKTEGKLDPLERQKSIAAFGPPSHGRLSTTGFRACEAVLS